MDAALLPLFLRIYETGGLSAAARSLGMSQPVLTKKLRRLEDQLRVRLFERTNRGLIPTAMARALADHAHHLQSSALDAQRMIEQMRDGIAGQVRLGTSALVAALLLPAVTLALRRQRPIVRLTVIEGLPQELSAAVRTGRVDAAICSIPNFADRGDLQSEVITQDHFGAVAARDYPLPRRSRLHLAELADHPWVITPYAGEPRRWFTEQFELAGRRPPEPAVETASVPYFRSLIATGAFIGFAPREMFHPEIRSGAAVFPLRQDLVLRRPIVLLTRRNAVLPPAGALVLDLIRRTASSDAPYGRRPRRPPGPPWGALS